MRIRIVSLISAAAFALVASASHAGAQAVASVCKDGTTSAVTGRGTCSGHGGVNAKATETARNAAKKSAKASIKAEKKAEHAEKKADKKEEKAEAKMVKCTDGALSKGGRGACSGHGGIAKGKKH
jgi:hypothetical protein